MRVLITAGPTWIKVDTIRVLTSVFTGSTGVYLAQRFKRKGGKVTLLINSHSLKSKIPAGVNVKEFRYFSDLQSMLKEELTQHTFDVVIHNAAVSDYMLVSPYMGKIPSGKNSLVLKFKKAPKLLKDIRRYLPSSLIIQFKLEIKKKELLSKALYSLRANRSDLVVANAWEDLKEGHYKGYIIDRDRAVVSVNSRRELFVSLYKKIKELTVRK